MRQRSASNSSFKSYRTRLNPSDLKELRLSKPAHISWNLLFVISWHLHHHKSIRPSRPSSPFKIKVQVLNCLARFPDLHRLLQIMGFQAFTLEMFGHHIQQYKNYHSTIHVWDILFLRNCSLRTDWFNWIFLYCLRGLFTLK